ncbi:MAG: hypothetical protein PHD48_02130 [Alphaproteobacteria bacterium]|nr:hypothetical protein [Alphaproteobacteria bacterium]
MRHTALLVALALLVAAPTSAKEAKFSGVPIFGFRNCRPTFPCPNTSSREQHWDMSSTVIGIADSCSRTYLGIRKPGSLFESTFGIDASMCLTTKKVEPDSSGVALTPKCCITPIDKAGKVCQVSCTLYGIK